ncbi:hypothetical protein [Actinoplanes sp. CA-252034]|uniref:hypothetical protein n=1 Tax=Actinoplanes sp. CA-252034 TaxID=3239906 RepID=UPI003D991B81
MSVFRASAGEPAHRPPVPPRPAVPGHRVPHQRAPEHGYPDGPTEPLGGEESRDPLGEAVARERAASFAEAAPRERAAPLGEAAARERAARERAARGNVARDTPVAPPPVRARRRPGVVMAVLFSLSALLVSGAAGWFSWRVLEATRAAATPRHAPAPVAAEPVRNRPSLPERYPVAYAKEPLRLQVACAAVLHMDLDEPRADAAEVLADLRYDGGCGTRPPQLSLGVGAAGGSSRVTADADAADCDRAIRTGPLGRGLQVEVKEGAAVCVLTAAVPAGLVLVEIIDVGGSGTAGLRATSWRVP